MRVTAVKTLDMGELKENLDSIRACMSAVKALKKCTDKKPPRHRPKGAGKGRARGRGRGLGRGGHARGGQADAADEQPEAAPGQNPQDQAEQAPVPPGAVENDLWRVESDNTSSPGSSHDESGEEEWGDAHEQHEARQQAEEAEAESQGQGAEAGAQQQGDGDMMDGIRTEVVNNNINVIRGSESIGRLAYQKRAGTEIFASVQVQCFNAAHSRCKVWRNLKNLASQETLVEWIASAAPLATAKEHTYRQLSFSI